MAQNLELDAWHRGAINNNTFGFENAYIFTTVVLKLICMGSSINHVYRQIATLLHKPYLVNVSKNGMGHMGGPPIGWVESTAKSVHVVYGWPHAR